MQYYRYDKETGLYISLITIQGMDVPMDDYIYIPVDDVSDDPASFTADPNGNLVPIEDYEPQEPSYEYHGGSDTLGE